MDLNVKQFLLKMDGTSELNFKGLVDYIEGKDYIEIVDSGIKMGLGLAYDKIYLDLYHMELEDIFDGELIFFVIAHELGHHFRLNGRHGKYVNEVLLLEDFDEFSDGVIKEERFADRFARLLFYKLNGKHINSRFLQNIYTEFEVYSYKRMCLEGTFAMRNQLGGWDSLLERVLFKRKVETNCN
jgi:hypothetical protein